LLLQLNDIGQLLPQDVTALKILTSPYERDNPRRKTTFRTTGLDQKKQEA